MARRASTFSMMSLSSAGVIPTVQPPLKVSVTLPCVRSMTGLHGACVLTSWAEVNPAGRNQTTINAERANEAIILHPTAWRCGRAKPLCKHGTIASQLIVADRNAGRHELHRLIFKGNPLAYAMAAARLPPPCGEGRTALAQPAPRPTKALSLRKMLQRSI